MQSQSERFQSRNKQYLSWFQSINPIEILFFCLYAIAGTLLIGVIGFHILSQIWFLKAPSRIMDDFRHIHWRFHDVGLHTPYGPDNIGYDIINPLDKNYDFPLINVHLDSIQPTFPSEYHHQLPPKSSQLQSLTTTSKQLDYEHPHLLPSLPIEIESPIHSEGVWNPAPIALPYNPLGYRYFMPRTFSRAKNLDEYRGQVNTATSQLTCFSDWFPYDLIKEQDDEQLAKVAELDKKTPGGVAYINTRQYGIKQPDWVSTSRPELRMGDEREPLLRVVINTTRIDKNILAKYYGYESSDLMPFHPRIPTQTTQTKWVHRCITPWKDDEASALTPHHYNKGQNGLQGTRTIYDRCGRLLIQYSASNDHGPFEPKVTMRNVEARVFEQGELLFRPLSDLCPIRHHYQHPIYLLGGGVEGHQKDNQYDWIMYPYGSTQYEIDTMIIIKAEFADASSFYDHRTNSLYLTKRNHLDLLTKFGPTYPHLMPPWRSIERKIPSRTNPKSRSVEYLRDASTHITDIAPFSIIKGPVEQHEKPLDKIKGTNTNIYTLQQCFQTFHQFRTNEFTTPYTARTLKAASNPILVHITPSDWANDPFGAFTPDYKRTPWVYFIAANDQSDENNYRPFILMIDAYRGTIIAIRPFNAVIPTNQCNVNQSCRFGHGSNCNDSCGSVQLHHLMAVQTPLSYSLISNATTTPSIPSTTNPHFNPITYDREFANDIKKIPFERDINEFFSSIVFDPAELVENDEAEPLEIPPFPTLPDFPNLKPRKYKTETPKSNKQSYNSPSTTTTTTTTKTTTTSTKHQRNSNTKRTDTTPVPPLSTNTTTQSLHFTLPTYYSLQSQIFAVITIDKKASYLQELDLMAFWRQRHPCNIKLDSTSYPSSIPQTTNNNNNPKATFETQQKLIQFTPIKAHMNVYDWNRIDPQPIRNTPYGLAQALDIPTLPAEQNWPRYASMDEYPKRAQYVYDKYVVPWFINCVLLLLAIVGIHWFILKKGQNQTTFTRLDSIPEDDFDTQSNPQHNKSTARHNQPY